jgi:hypothetical protein
LKEAIKGIILYVPQEIVIEHGEDTKLAMQWEASN